jgi:WD40 repeat protein
VTTRTALRLMAGHTNGVRCAIVIGQVGFGSVQGSGFRVQGLVLWGAVRNRHRAGGVRIGSGFRPEQPHPKTDSNHFLQSLWTGSDDKTVRVWPLADNFQGGPDGVRSSRVLSGHSDSVVSLCVGSGGEHVWSSSAVSSFLITQPCAFAHVHLLRRFGFCAREYLLLRRARRRPLSRDSTLQAQPNPQHGVPTTRLCEPRLLPSRLDRILSFQSACACKLQDKTVRAWNVDGSKGEDGGGVVFSPGVRCGQMVTMGGSVW